VTPEEWAERQESWTKAERDFDHWPLSGTACDGSPIRRHEDWGDGVFERESGMVISPVAYAVRRALRAERVMPFGDKS